MRIYGERDRRAANGSPPKHAPMPTTGTRGDRTCRNPVAVPRQQAIWRGTATRRPTSMKSTADPSHRVPSSSCSPQRWRSSHSSRRRSPAPAAGGSGRGPRPPLRIRLGRGWLSVLQDLRRCVGGTAPWRRILGLRCRCRRYAARKPSHRYRRLGTTSPNKSPALLFAHASRACRSVGHSRWQAVSPVSAAR